MEQHHARTSKFISLVLRHQPEIAGLTLDEHGWVPVEALLAALNAQGMNTDLPLLQQLVETNDKKRFSFSEDGLYLVES